MANLLNKLRESKLEAAKRIGAVALAGAIALGGTTACSNLNINNPTAPNIGGISDSTNPGTPTSSSNQENENHSALLMSVVNDEYYKSLMARTKIEDYAIPALDAHPYAFLEDEGIDVNKILDGTYKASTMTFVLDEEPNNLYINTRILIDDSYYQAYLLTYQLTDKEMADYRLIHGDSKEYSYSWPAFFINDKISETKQPTKVLSTKYTKKTHEVFKTRATSSNNQPKDYILPSIDFANKTYTYLHYPKHYDPNIAQESRNILIATLRYSRIFNVHGIYEITENFDAADVQEKATKTATTFNVQDSTIFRGKAFETLTNEN